MIKHRILAWALLTSVAPTAMSFATPALAQSAADFEAMRAEIAALKAEQKTSAQRISQLETALNESHLAAATPAPAQGGGPPVFHAAVAQSPVATPAILFRTAAYQSGAAGAINPAGGSAPGTLPASIPSKLTLNGDLRLRYESNFGDRDGIGRDRLVLRGRLRAAYAVNKWLTIGGQLTTGDPNDPNSTDVTLSGFDNDLQVSLDQAYLRANVGNLTLVGGKIPQPLVRTELVWDGDVSPEGVSASYKVDLGSGASVRANGLYFVVDEAPAAKDSRMVGGQLQFETGNGPIKVELAAGYYDYKLRSVAGGDVGDFRTNRMVGGRYLSDFNLLDIIGAVQFNGLGERWPVRLVGDYVHNYGATTSQDSGFGVDLLVGRATKQGDLRFGYGYAELGVDAVLAAFSHDNTDLATNYRQHTLFAETVVMPNVVLNATYYRYRPKSSEFTTAFLHDDWLNRLRLNMLVNF